MRITLWGRYWSERLGSAAPSPRLCVSAFQNPPMKASPIREKPSVRLNGVCALAARLGVTPSHLSRVIKGERRSPRLERRLAALGVRCGKGAAK